MKIATLKTAGYSRTFEFGSDALQCAVEASRCQNASERHDAAHDVARGVGRRRNGRRYGNRRGGLQQLNPRAADRHDDRIVRSHSGAAGVMLLNAAGDRRTGTVFGDDWREVKRHVSVSLDADRQARSRNRNGIARHDGLRAAGERVAGNEIAAVAESNSAMWVIVAPADADAEIDIVLALEDTEGDAAVAAPRALATLGRVAEPVTVARTLVPAPCGSPL